MCQRHRLKTGQVFARSPLCALRSSLTEEREIGEEELSVCLAVAARSSQQTRPSSPSSVRDCRHRKKTLTHSKTHRSNFVHTHSDTVSGATDDIMSTRSTATLHHQSQETYKMTRNKPANWRLSSMSKPKKRRKKPSIEHSSNNNNYHQQHNHRNHMIPFVSCKTTPPPLRQSESTTTTARRRRRKRGDVGVVSRKSFSFFTTTTTTLLSVAILAYQYHPLVDCLDSPVKIQRNKQQLLQPKQQSGIGNTTTHQDDNRQTNSIADSRISTESAAAAAVAAAIAILNNNNSNNATSSEQDSGYSRGREERVKRTNVNRRAASRIELECPPRRLLQSLLPPEYLGSPAMQAGAGGQRQSRGSCDCVLELSGWQINCVAGDEASLLMMSPNADGRSRLPNQLHPAFRGPQLERHKLLQQQQQQVSNVPLVGNRRVHRSPTRWMGEELSPRSQPRTSDNSEQPSIGSSASSNAELSTPENSVHEGFGEETASQITSRPGSRSSTMRNNSGSEHQAAADSDSFLSLPSIASFSMMMRGEHNSSHSSEDKEAASRVVAAASDNDERLINQDNHNSNNNNNDHLMYETVPILFSVKYTTTRNMIEINCDKAAPNYKAAMFQGKSLYNGVAVLGGRNSI